MAGYRNEPLDTLIELGREQSRMMMVGGATLVLSVLGLVGVLGVAKCLGGPEETRECVTSVEHHTQLSTDLCKNMCFRDNYLGLQQKYIIVNDLGLKDNVPDLAERIATIAYRKAEELCK